MTDEQQPSTNTSPAPLVEVCDVVKTFRTGGQFGGRNSVNIHALNGVSLRVYPSEVFCIVGESGCGKSTLAQIIAGLHKPDKGKVLLNGERIDNTNTKSRRRAVQMIFQNPDASLNPRMTIKQMLTEVVRFHFPHLTAKAALEEAAQALNDTGLSADALPRYPHQFSGGQRQRLSIARALIAKPQFVIADEPVAALDVSVQAQILNLLGELRAKQGLAFLFISHDLSVVRAFGDRAAVMYLGAICEQATCGELFQSPRHPYSKMLLSAAPAIGKPLPSMTSGEQPSPSNMPPGCPFHPRCPNAAQSCQTSPPPLTPITQNRKAACYAITEGRI